MAESYVYGRLYNVQCRRSNIFGMQKQLGHLVEDVMNEENPFQFRKVGGSLVNWKNALDIASDVIDMNLSKMEGDRFLSRISNIVLAETGHFACLPKRCSTLIDVCCKDLLDLNAVKMWKGDILPNYFDEEFLTYIGRPLAASMKPFKAPYIDVECAIAELLLKIQVVDFEDRIGPRYEVGEDGEKVRVLSTFGSGDYAIEMQNFVNNYLVDAETKPLLLAISVWLDKAPMNSSMKSQMMCYTIFLFTLVQ